VYQLMFAIITPALITGAFAERMKFSAMVAFLVWSIMVYAPMAHMVWGKGGLLNAALGGAVPHAGLRRGHGRTHHLRRFGPGVTIGLRVSEEQEAQGLDLSQHGEEGYYWEGSA
jgi:ammonia channel protein AmtB